jgi:hypothetical protein
MERPGARERLEATKVKGDYADGQIRAMSRKDALKRLNSLEPRAEEHLAKIANNPGNRDIPHWTAEITNWIAQMENALPRAGDKTAAEWAARIAGWKARPGN